MVYGDRLLFEREKSSMLCSEAAMKRMLSLIVCSILLGISFNVINVEAPTTPRMYVDTYPPSGAGDIIDESMRPGQIPVSGVSQINSYPSTYIDGYGNVTQKPTSHAFNGSWTNPGNAYDILPTTYALNDIASPFKSFRSFPSNYATNGSVSNPTNAYDKDQASFATYSISGNPAPPQATYFEVTTFNASGVYTRPTIDLIVRWNATVGEFDLTTNYAEFRILYYVGAKSNVLVPWVSVNVTVHTDAFQSLYEPNDGIWSNTDINNLKLRVETRKLQVGGTAAQYGSVRVFEVWVSGGEVGFSWFTMSGFSVTPGTGVVSLGFKMRLWTTLRGCSYRILFYVGSQYKVLLDWTNLNETTSGGAIVVWDDQPEPNDGSWSDTDVSNIVLRVETKKAWVDGTGTFRIYDTSSYSIQTPTPAGLITNPGSAYDQNMLTYAQVDISKNLAIIGGWSWFDPTGFNTSIVNPYAVTAIDINMNYTASPLTSAYYRIMLHVGDKSKELLAWSAVPWTEKTILTFVGVPEPNDGVWNWTDIDNMRIGFETKKATAAGSGLLKIYEVWVQLPIDRVVIGVSVADAYDLYSYRFFLNWTGTMFDGMNVIEGPFLKSVGPTFFTYRNYNDATGNYTKVTCTLQLPAHRGPDGNGVLAYIALLVQGYGSTKLQLYDTGMADSFGFETTHTTTNGYFDNRLTGDITGPENPPGSGLYPPDKKIDGYDLFYLGKKFGTNDPLADFTGPENPVGSGTYPPDGIVDGRDLTALGKNFGRSIP